jgi:BirA family biotin operon repressor/biotin-[acetyl-CoA-carboxylase] ligase
MDKVFDLLARLNDGQSHSGEALAAELGITRAAVWNRVQRLQALGVDVYAVAGKGYRLAQGFDFLDIEQIHAHLTTNARRVLHDIACAVVTDSTNQRLLELATEHDIHGSVRLAEYQTAGRGRRGDVWIAPPGSGVCLSLGWRFDSPPHTMSALSLAVGVAVARSARALGVDAVMLKWPNDVLYHDRKLAGILIEMRSEYGGPSTVVIGVGLNTHINPDVRARISQPVADLGEALPAPPARNLVAATLLNNLIEVLDEFATAGFAPFADEWRASDGLAGRRVILELPDRRVVGDAAGVDARGMLLIAHAGGCEPFLSGHVRLAETR